LKIWKWWSIHLIKNNNCKVIKSKSDDKQLNKKSDYYNDKLNDKSNYTDTNEKRRSMSPMLKDRRKNQKCKSKE